MPHDRGAATASKHLAGWGAGGARHGRGPGARLGSRGNSAGGARPGGALGWLVRIADSEWDEGLVRACALLGGVLVAAGAAVATRIDRWPSWAQSRSPPSVVALIPSRACSFRSGFGTPPSRGFSRTTPHTRSSWRVSSSSTVTTRTATTTARPGSNASTASTGRSAPSTQGRASRLRPFRLLPGHCLFLRGLAPAAGSVRRLPAARAPLDARPARSGPAVPGPLPWRLAAGAVLAANPSPSGPAGSGPRTPRASSSSSSRLHSAPARGLPGLPSALGPRCSSNSSARRPSRSSGRWSATSGLPRRELWRVATAFGGVLLAGFLPFLIADAARSIATPSPTGPTRIGSSATEWPGSPSSSASSRSGPIRIPSALAPSYGCP